MHQVIGQLRTAAAALANTQREWIDRLIAELEFAVGLAKLEKHRDWPALVERAAKPVADACEGSLAAGLPSRADAIAPAVRQAEAKLAAIGRAAKRYTVHCVGHAHIDMNWLWSWPETVAVANDTFLTVLRLMDEFDAFTFTQSQASVYRIIAEHNPAMLEQIRRRIRQGRWEVAAVNWVEGDKNLAGGESLARHLLYTRRYIADLLGLAPEELAVQWEPDTFGHAWTIPTISSRGGVRCYYLCRGGRQIDKPPVFWWQGPDGSRVLVNLETTWYNDHIGPHNTTALLNFCGKTELRDWMNVYGVGDHGGGPTRRDIVRGLEMDRWPIFPNFRFATARSCFDRLLAEGDRWPVIRNELNFEFAGCYTTQTQIKLHNRRAEAELAVAESAAVVARCVGGDYPRERLREGWLNTLFGQFHDILPGSGVRATREYQSGLFQQTMAITSIVKSSALRSLAAAVDTVSVAEPRAGFSKKAHGQSGVSGNASIALGGGVGFGVNAAALPATSPVSDGPRPFVVFNPTAWPRQETITLTVWDWPAASGKKPVLRARTAAGRTLPAQKIGGGDYWGHQFAELAVPVAVGPLGYATCTIEPGDADAPAGVYLKLTRHELLDRGPASPLCTIENESIVADFDRATGGIRRLIDKATGCQLADAANPLGVLEYVLERPTGMSAWVIGDALKRVSPLPLESLKVEQAGPHVASVVAKTKLNESTITITYTLRAGQPGVEIAIVADWLERGGPAIGTPSLRMLFPAALRDAAGRYEIPFGSIERSLTDGQEVPALRWAEVFGAPSAKPAGRGRSQPASLVLLNDCKHGHSLLGSTLGLTLIRSSYDPDPLPEIGRHEIRLMVVPRGRRPAAAEVIRLGAAFNQPLQAVPTDVHAGSLPAAALAVEVTPTSVVLAGVKQAEDDEAVVLRLQETAGRSATATVKLNAQLLGRIARAVEVDLLERLVQGRSARVRGNTVTVKVPANGITSVKVFRE